jgi:hypothetical protein
VKNDLGCRKLQPLEQHLDALEAEHDLGRGKRFEPNQPLIERRT